MLLALLLASCAEPPEPRTDLPTQLPPYQVRVAAFPEGPALTLLEPAAGFVVAEQDPIRARARRDGADVTPVWRVNGDVAACGGADPLVCEFSGLPPGSVEICVGAEGVAPSCAAGWVVPCTDTLWYPDADGDTFGVRSGGIASCAALAGRARAGGDCDDTDPAAHPGAAEVCNDQDDDCDGVVDDDATDAAAWYRDADGDGHGAAGAPVRACVPPSGHVAYPDDCDDTNAAVSPGRVERCNGHDDNCDGVTDVDAVDPRTWYADADKDGFGDPAAPDAACVARPGTVADSTDCDDADAAVHPGAAEWCNGEDDDCDLATDEAGVGGPAWYADADGDGYGHPAVSVSACAAPSGFVASAADCDDADAAVSPAGAEACNERDDDCDGLTDEADAVDAPTWYDDIDGDGFGDPWAPRPACTLPAGSVADATDCDDRDPLVAPGAAETCDGVDEDCDGTIDGAETLDGSTWYADTDGDGFGDPTAWAIACEAPDAHVADASDCDDADPETWPGAVERLDAADQDCDGLVDNLAAPWNTDLVDNGGFELGDLTGWTLDAGTCAVMRTGDLDWISAYEGDYLFYGGAAATTDCQVSQEFDLLALGLTAAELDSGRAAVDALAVLAHEMHIAWRSAPSPSLYDRTSLRVRYLSDTGEDLGSIRTLLSEDDDWAVRGVMGVLPEGTRTVRVELDGLLRRGLEVDAVADAVSVSVGAIEPTVPTITKLPFLQDFREDAMRLLWETDDNRCAHVVEWAPTGEALANTVTLVDTVEVDAAHYVHVATIEGLVAGTEYDYRVGSGGTWSDTYTFRTAPAVGEPFAIGWLGDNESGTNEFEASLQGMLDHNVDLYFSPGDVVWDGDEVEDWANEWFTPLETANFSQTHPVLFARGNHDDHHALSYAYSALPGVNEDWYSFTYGNVFFVVLDSESPTDETLAELSQVEFLQQAITSDEALLADFRIVVFHNAPYTAARHDNASVGLLTAQADWVPIFEDNDVDLVISGHYHSYQRGTQNGVTYLIVGGGGGYLDDRATGLYPFMEVVELTHHYAMMEVDGPNLTWTVYDDDEVEIDNFAITAE